MEIETSTGFKLKFKSPGIVGAGVLTRLKDASDDTETQLAGLGAMLGFVVDHPSVNDIKRPERDPKTGARTLGAWLDFGEQVADALFSSGDVTLSDVPAISEGLKAMLSTITEGRVKN